MGVSTAKRKMVPVVRGVKWIRAFTVKWGMKEMLRSEGKQELKEDQPMLVSLPPLINTRLGYRLITASRMMVRRGSSIFLSLPI